MTQTILSFWQEVSHAEWVGTKHLSKFKANGRFQGDGLSITLSAMQDYGTGLQFVPDNPDAPAGPVGAIFTLSEHFLRLKQPVSGFYTVPVDAPQTPLDLLHRLRKPHTCTVAASNGQIHPVFAYWHCNIVKSVPQTNDHSSKAPSLHWLARQCDSEVIEWDDDEGFANINTPSKNRRKPETPNDVPAF